jgi:hypothetical protein
MRAALDVDHTRFLNQMRMPRPGQPRINANHTKKHQMILKKIPYMAMGIYCCHKQQRADGYQ